MLSGIGSFIQFRHRSGPYFFRSLALSALAISILYTVPMGAARLFARRLVAFVIDLLFFSVGTIGLGSLLFEVGTVKPSALTSMAIVWIWFLLFVVLDWAFAGTPGKKMMGLRLKGRNSEGPSFLGFLARNLLTLLVPLTVSGSVLSILTRSKTMESATWAIAAATLSFCPLSVVFFGGQSLPDLLVGIAVLPNRSYDGPTHVPQTVRAWLLLLLASVSTGAAYGFTPSMDSGIVPGVTLPQFPVRENRASGQAEAQMAAGLWPYVQAGMGESGDLLEDVRVYSVKGELPGPVGMELDPQAAYACEQSFKTKRSYKIIRLQINPVAPSMTVASVFGNMLNLTNRFAGRPAFFVLEVSTKRSFGVFDIELPEDYIFCMAGSDAAPEINLANATRSFTMGASFNALACLFLGNLGNYSRVENVAVYPWQD